MATSKFPNLPNHLVYVFHANEYPFYVGHGKLGRLSDRPTYVDRLIRLHPDRNYYKWTHHGKVIADLWNASATVYFDQITSGQTKAEASLYEDRLLEQLVNEGFLMANERGNKNLRSPEDIVASVLQSAKRWSFLGDLKPITRYVRPTR